jgi:hypothetical protein
VKQKGRNDLAAFDPHPLLLGQFLDDVHYSRFKIWCQDYVSTLQAPFICNRLNTVVLAQMDEHRYARRKLEIPASLG